MKTAKYLDTEAQYQKDKKILKNKSNIAENMKTRQKITEAAILKRPSIKRPRHRSTHAHHANNNSAKRRHEHRKNRRRRRRRRKKSRG